MKDFKTFNNECMLQIRGFLFTGLYNDVPEDVKDRIYDRMDRYTEDFAYTIWQCKVDNNGSMYDSWRDIRYKIIGYVNALIDCKYIKFNSNMVIIDTMYRLFTLLD